jgi:transposase
MAERKTRKIHPPEFKAKIALEAIIGDRTITEIAKEYGLYPNQVIQWKTQGLEGLVDSFRQSEKPVQATLAKAGRRNSHLNSLFQQVDKLVKGEEEEEPVSDEVEEPEEKPEEKPVKTRRTRKSSKSAS